MANTHEDSPITILQWNSQSIKPKLVDLQSLLIQEKVHIAIIGETWLNPGVTIRISGYNTYRKDRSDSYGGVAIITHHSLKTHVTSFSVNNSNIELVHVKILNCSRLENIVSIYCPSNMRTT